MTNLGTATSELHQNCYQMSLDNDLTDVTFVTTDRDEVRAHKVNLGAASPYLKERMHNDNKNYILMNTSMMKKLIEYIYTGNTTQTAWVGHQPVKGLRRQKAFLLDSCGPPICFGA